MYHSTVVSSADNNDKNEYDNMNHSHHEIKDSQDQNDNEKVSIPHGFPTVEVTVDSSSCMSASDYDDDDDASNFQLPISPLTPIAVEREDDLNANVNMMRRSNSGNILGSGNGSGPGTNMMGRISSTKGHVTTDYGLATTSSFDNMNHEARNLMNVLKNVSSKTRKGPLGGLGFAPHLQVHDHDDDDVDDVHMGVTSPSPPRRRQASTPSSSSLPFPMAISKRGRERSTGSRKGVVVAPRRDGQDDGETPNDENGRGIVVQDAGEKNHVFFLSESPHTDNSSDTTPTRNQRISVFHHPSSRRKQLQQSQSQIQQQQQHPFTSPVSMASSYQQQEKYQEYPQPPYLMGRIQKKFRVGESTTLHAQTFVLALAFFAIWSPQNLMAPNLTQMATYFHFTTEQRDLYLGANIAFATGVLSLPVQTLLGFLADVVPSRKQLFAFTVMGGGIASILTGCSTTYTQLYFCRFLCGGCMSGSVPIAFSMLGDLFDAKDRNAASSGLTAMMGAGILFGQVYAGAVGEWVGWKRPFYVSGALSIVTSLMVLYFVKEPVRGGKERVLQEMIANGTKYDRKLTVEGFLHAMTQNKTNVILMLQSFSTSVPWGIIFTFLNDYFSQEQGMSVAASTILIVWFGLGCAAGGIIGGTIGTKLIRINRSFLPLFMSFSTAVGILPFLGLLDLKLHGASLLAIFLAFVGPCIANLPSVNVRPCLLNVNPPETRGAAMTAANLMVNVGRGAGPSIVTLSQQFFDATRQYSFNLSLIVFWSITTLLLAILAKTLPHDQDAMDAELERYAESKIKNRMANEGKIEAFPAFVEFDEESSAQERLNLANFVDDLTLAGEESIISIEDRITSFDACALHESWTFIGGALREIAEASHIRNRPHPSYEMIDEQENDQHLPWRSQSPPPPSSTGNNFLDQE